MLLIKYSPSFYVSHLYRQLYTKSIDDFFRSKNLFRFLDYSIYGTTYHKGGVVTIQINFLSRQAEELAYKIANLEINTDAALVGIRVLQYMAEQKKPITGKMGMDNLKQSLQNLHTQPWQDASTVTVIDTKNITMKADTVIIEEYKKQHPRTLTVDISLHPKVVAQNPELLPLFAHLSYFIYQNSLPEIAASFGAYSEGAGKALLADDFKMPFTFRIAPQAHSVINDNKRIQEILFIFLDCVKILYKPEVTSHILGTLQSKEYDTPSYSMLDLGFILQSTGLFVGAKGWRQTATIDNCELLIKNMAITVKYGRKRISLPAPSSLV